MKVVQSVSVVLLAVLLLFSFTLLPQPSQAAQQLPDLIVTEMWDSDNQVCYTIKNVGEGTIGVIAPATFWNALFIDGEFNASDEVSVSLAPGGQIDRCFSYQWQMTDPQHTIEVCADWGQNMIEESNEQNNCLEEVWTQDLPDLIVDDIECGPGNKLAVTIKNIGSGSLPAQWSALARVYFDSQDQGFFDLGSPASTTGGGIANPGGSSYYLLAWDITAPVTVMVIADYTYGITESSEQNNSKSETLEPTPTPTPPPTPTPVTTPSPTPTATPILTPSPTPTPTPIITHSPAPSPTITPSATPASTPKTTPTPTPKTVSSPTPTPITIIAPTPVFVACWYSISGTIHDFWHDESTLRIEVCDAETISLRPGPYGPVLPPITQCKEGGHVWYADITRQFEGDLPGPDLVYNLRGLCPGEYIVAPVYNPGADLCEWQGSWRSAKGQVVRIEDSSATGFDFTFEPIDSGTPAVSDILANPEQPEIAEDVVVTILAEDDIEIAAIWEKTDTVFTDGSFHAGSWHSLTVTPGLEGSTAGVQFSITDDRIAEATVTAKVCDIGGNSHMAQKVITFGSCDDGIQNQGESGIDCGGPCPSECINCLDSSAIGSNPSAYLYSPENISFIQSTALVALSEYANEHSIMVTELDTSDEYIEAISWWVARHMGYRGDDQNRQCLNDILGLDYEPDDYDHGDFPVPAYYTLNFSGRALASNPSKWYYGDCEDFAILESALLRSLGVSYRCIFNAEGPGHGYNVVNYQNKYRILEPQSTSRSSDIGIEERTGMYNLYNLWNDRVGAFGGSGFPKVWPWEYTMNYPGCEGLTVSASGGGFGEKTLWLDWEDRYAEIRMPAVGDFDGDGLDDIAFVWFRGSEAYGRFEAAVLSSTGSSFVSPSESLDRAHEGTFTPITVADTGRDYIVALYDNELECVGGTPRECSGCPGHVFKWYCSEVNPLVRIGDTDGNNYPNVVEFLKGDASDVTVNGATWASGFSPGDEVPFVGDFDGDGLADIISFENETWGGVRVARSVPEEDRFCAHELWHRSFALDQEPNIGDFNGDGRTDIISFDPDNGNVYVGLSTKFGFWSQGFDSQWLWKSDFCDSRNTLLIGDFDGDGLDDIACLSVDDDEVQVWVSLALPSSITYNCHGGNMCEQASFYIDAYWPSTCP